jgi:hypothetical protein
MSRYRNRLRLVFGVSIALLALVIGITPATAAPVRQVGRAPQAIVGGTHNCQNFGGTSGAGYVAGHCADIDEFVNSLGYLALRGQGQAFCQRASDGVIVQCAGISQRVTITNLTTGETIYANPVCGRYGGSACPAGRFQNLSPGIYEYCGDSYVATVRTTVVLPVDAQTSRSGDFNSIGITIVC